MTQKEDDFKDFFVKILSGDDFIVEAKNILVATMRATEIAEHHGRQIIMIYDVELKKEIS